MARFKVVLFDMGIYYPSTITDGNGASQTVQIPLSGGKVYAYDPNTTDDQSVYDAVTGGSALSQPFTLDSNGRKEVFVDNQAVKFVIKDSTETTTIRTIDYMDGQRDTFVDNVTFNGTVTFGASFGFADGTVGSPGMQFSSDTDTGRYRIGANNMADVIGGSAVVDYDSTGIEMKLRLETIAGTAAAPSSVSASDTDTGPFYPGANQYGISCGGTLIGEFTSAAFIMDYPIYHSAGSASAPAVTREGDVNTGIYFSAADTMNFSAGGNEQMEIIDGGVNFPNGADLGDAGTYIKVKVVQIGDWDMDADPSTTVAHGLTASKIRSITGYVRDDTATTYYPLSGGATNSSTLSDAEITSWGSTNITLSRLTSGSFDSTSFDSTSFNRGHIVIVHEA